ncbi:histidine kinase [uncultured Draconibacterium sp.]|uniref:sensor histidine kinase n=1 Tax=uncultured Draconibacterium sp. TaxID=1573823 RepID=UPI003217594A
MIDKTQKIISLLQRSKTMRIVYHIVFWVLVVFFNFILFSWNSEFREVTIIFSLGLLPVAILVTYFFNYTLVPKYLLKKRYGRFFLFSFYTLLAATWLSFLIVFFALIFILNKEASLDPAVLHPELQVVTLYFIVFFAIAIKQVKRAFVMQQEKSELEKNKLNTELKLKEAELKLLKAQIHPHFLFNTLNNLYGLTLEKSDKAPDLVLRLSDILDYILYRCDEKRVLLSDELANLKNYIEIEKIRYSGKLKMQVDFPSETNNLQIAPLIILPFIENAFKHGVSNYPGVAFVNIKLHLIDQTLIFKIENSKNQVVNATSNHSKGIGLKNARKRLDLIFPEKYILKIDDKTDSFSVNLTLNLEEQ